MGIMLLRAFCRLLAASGLLVFIYYIWDWLNDSFFEWFAPLYNNWAMKYPYAGGAHSAAGACAHLSSRFASMTCLLVWA